MDGRTGSTDLAVPPDDLAGNGSDAASRSDLAIPASRDLAVPVADLAPLIDLATADASAGAGGAQPGALWPTLGGDFSRRGSSDETGPSLSDPARFFQSPERGALMQGSPAVDAQGTVYIGSLMETAGDPAGRFFAIGPDGLSRWTFRTGAPIRSAPTVGADGTIYVGADDHLLYAMRPDGTERWRFNAVGAIGGSVAIGRDGTLFFAAVGAVYALHPSDGTVKWMVGLPTERIAPALSPIDDTVYVGTGSGSGPDPFGDARALHALDPRTGATRWKFSTNGAIRAAAVVDPRDGSIYVHSTDGQVTALQPNGSKKWVFYVDRDLGGVTDALSPAIDDSGIVYLATAYRALYKIRLNGAIEWTVSIDGTPVSSPIIDGTGTIFLATRDEGIPFSPDRLYAISANALSKRMVQAGLPGPATQLAPAGAGIFYLMTGGSLYFVR